MSEEQINTILQMYREGISFSKIAAKVGKSDNTVKHWVRQNRGAYGLDKRRNKADKTGALSYAVEQENTWNTSRGVELISRRWA